MIIEVNDSNLASAAKIHSESWKESHESFCSMSFIEQHTVEHQKKYLRSEIEARKKSVSVSRTRTCWNCICS